jgi:flagellar basal-body rod modification protein FlgD
MVAATNSTPNPASSAASASNDVTALGKANLVNNFDTFLTLLTTQLKNQDPLSPMDSTQFTQQLVQMSGVEQQLLTNDLLKQISSNTGTGISTAVGLIGKNVKAVSDNAQLANGKADWVYNLPADAASMTVQIVDANGRSYHAETLSGDQLKAGDHAFSWNGKDMTGTKAPDGVYTLKLTAVDASGTAIDTTTYVQGVVGSVEQSNGQTLIAVGPTKVDWSTVKSITEAGSGATSSSTAQGGS